MQAQLPLFDVSFLKNICWHLLTIIPWSLQIFIAWPSVC